MDMNDIVNTELYPKRLAVMKAKAAQDSSIVRDIQSIQQDSSIIEDVVDISAQAMKLFKLSPSY